jgi:hypothetical protein
MNSSNNGKPKNQTPGTKKLGRGGARPGAGRKKGTVEPQTLAIREIARSITLGNPKVVARLNREAELGTINPAVLINLIDRGWGRPIPMEAEAKEAVPSLVFASTHGYVPWDDRIPEAVRMNARSEEMIAAKELELQAREAELALESGKTTVTAADNATADRDVTESLELVVPPPELSEFPEAFTRPTRERDRGR